MPFTVDAHVVLDLATDPGEAMPIGDFHRARVGLPLACDASAADLVAAEERAVRVDGSLWLRSRCGEQLSRRALGAPATASNSSSGIEALRQAHMRTVVECTGDAETDVAEQQSGVTADTGAVADITRELRKQLIARGAFWTISMVELAVSRPASDAA
jgi:hypothetical protein